jgi:Zn-dependent protease
MFRTAWTVGRVRGIPIRLHVSLLLVVPFISAAVADRDLPHLLARAGIPPSHLSLPLAVHGLLMALALFVGVALHELGHALVALSQGGRVRAITLMLLGGVTELEHEEATPKQQAWMAFAGPLVSLVLGGASLALSVIPQLGLDAYVALQLFGYVNLTLALFNLVPAYPLDGGRILRALLHTRLTATRATEVAAGIGRALAVLLLVFALFPPLKPMLVLMATVIYFGAGMEAAALTLRDRLTGLKARQAMVTRVASVEPDLALPAVARHMLFQGASAALVRDAQGIYGVILPNDLRRGVEGVARDRCGASPVFVNAEDDLGAVAKQIQRSGQGGAIVQDGFNIIVGVVTHDELARALALRSAADTTRAIPPDTTRPVKAESYDTRQ